MKFIIKKFIALLLILALYIPNANMVNAERILIFENEIEELKSPKELMIENNVCDLRVGDALYFPLVVKDIIPRDEIETFEPEIDGAFSSTDEKIAFVDKNGYIVAINEGECDIIYEKPSGKISMKVNVSNSTIPLGIRNLTYIGKREFLFNQMSRLPKYNQYAKWYYKKKKEVGWCSVFTSYATNASGIDTYKHNTIPIDEINNYSVFGLLEGQVGHQWDGFTSVNRFTNIPQPGYYVIYGNRKNAYRFTHVGLVVDVEQFPDGWYKVTTVEGNMSNTVKKYCYMYNSNIEHPKENMAEVEKDQQTNALTQYKLHTDFWDVFGFCATWEPIK